MRHANMPFWTPLWWTLLGCGVQPEAEPVSVEAGTSTTAVGDYVGSQRCGECHSEAWEAHQDPTNQHARAEEPASVLSARTVDLDAGQGVQPHAIEGWIGLEPMRQPLVGGPSGTLHASSMAWDVTHSEWFDVFADGREPGDRGHWTGPAMNWNTNCAACHNTGWRGGREQGQWVSHRAEMGVGCEACHGPGGGHPESDVLSDPSQSCAACHSRRADLAPHLAPNVRFLDRYAPQLVDAGPTFWPNGRARDEVFEWSGFASSRMAQQGVVCTDCHDPHRGTLLREGDALCLGCHGVTVPFEAHDRHGGEVACVDCHMPATTYMQRDPRRDHAFTIPDPTLAVELGLPDTCTEACHTDRTPQWSQKVVQTWEIEPHRSRARARAVANAHAHDATQGLLALVGDPHPYWQAVGVGLLSADPSAEALVAVVSAAQSEDPLVRFAAAGALPPLHPHRLQLARDPVRSVRVSAQRGLVEQHRPDATVMSDLLIYLQAHPDDPETAIELARWRAWHGDPQGERTLRELVERWPRESRAAHALSVVLARSGQQSEAVAVLEQAVSHQPLDAALWDSLGRGRAGVGDLAGARSALERAVELDAEAGRTLYNLGLVVQALGEHEPALAAFSRAESASPRDPDPAWARASLLAELGRIEQAQQAVEVALRIDPRHRGALSLHSELEKKR